jgi:hypothetical protein
MNNRRLSPEDIGNFAEVTFEELIKYWLEDVIITKDTPDRAGIDRRCLIPSTKGFHNQVAMNWQVKARSISIQNSRIYGEPCFTVKLRDRERKSLMNIASQNTPAFLALGIPTRTDFELLNTPLHERFHWYAIDINQYISKKSASTSADVKSIQVPARNHLNLASLSLIWGSLWASKLISLLTSQIIFKDPLLFDLASLFLQNAGRLESAEGFERSSLPKEYQTAIGHLPKTERIVANFFYGNAVFCHNIGKLIKESSGVDFYKVYAAEALGEELNLWLFSRPYRRYLRLTAAATPNKHADAYIRMLPSKWTDVRMMPRAIRCGFYLVMKSQGRFGVKTGIVDPLPEEPGDHIVAKGIGRIRTSIIGKSDNWSLSVRNNRHVIQREYELLSHGEKTMFFSSSLPESELLNELLLKPPEVFLGTRPIDLLAEENAYIEHPIELFAAF